MTLSLISSFVRPLASAWGGSFQIADQRTADFPVTFALHIVLLLEHNRCCVDVAPTLGFEGDEVWRAPCHDLDENGQLLCS